MTLSLQDKFLEYFQSKGHKIINSSSVVPENDQTLLFTNSGMVQFKSLFSSLPEELPYNKATSSQHCIRAGGKHNDLDDVGKDSYHHTYFVMLGNWSFGEYFKKEAIFYAYDFLVNVLKLDATKMYVTYYDGSNDSSTGDLRFSDDETKKLWMKYFSEDRILPFDKKDNFWEMGDTGPCGPCTEIHYDTRESGENNGSCLVNKDDPDVIEIWNIVFIEYYRNFDKSLTPLKMKCIDTGMGMERVERIIKKVKSNYLTDGFVNILKKIEDAMQDNNPQGTSNEKITDEKRSNVKRSNEKRSNDKTIEENTSNACIDNRLVIYRDTYDITSSHFHNDMSMRVIADHSRTIAICLFYGIIFSSEGRGYVLRRIMRRAVRFCKELGLENVMKVFVKEASKNMKIEIEDKIKMIEEEEKLFLKTLEKGKKILYKKINEIRSEVKETNTVECEVSNNERINEEHNKISSCVLPGSFAFLLYDTFGFPFDLTEIMCNEKGIEIDKEEFEVLKEKGKEKSRKKKEEKEHLEYKEIEMLNEFEKCNDEFKYYKDSLESEIVCIIQDGKVIYKKSSTIKDDTSINASVKGKDSIKDRIKYFEKLSIKSECKKGLCNEYSNSVGEYNTTISISNGSRNNTNTNSNTYNSNTNVDYLLPCYILTKDTCFYSESGGQIGDCGVIEMNDYTFDINDTRKFNGYVIHIGYIKSNSTNVNATAVVNIPSRVCLKVDSSKRNNTKKNHSGTHILNYVLRNIFNGVEQKGSFVDDKKLRFDFSCSKSINKEEIKLIEDKVNEIIKNEIAVEIKDIKVDDVNNTQNTNSTISNTPTNTLGNVIMMKDEKYPEIARCVFMGNFGELCGGTHVSNTKEISKFRIVSEGSISANVRRIVAVTGREAEILESNINNGSGDIPLYEKLCLLEKQKEEDKKKSIIKKEKVNKNIERMKVELNKKRHTPSEGTNTFCSTEINALNTSCNTKNEAVITNLIANTFTSYFVFLCDFDDVKSVSKDINLVSTNIEKLKVDSIVLCKIDGFVYFCIRGDSCEFVGDEMKNILNEVVVGGNKKCVSGKGKMKEIQ